MLPPYDGLNEYCFDSTCCFDFSSLVNLSQGVYKHNRSMECGVDGRRSRVLVLLRSRTREGAERADFRVPGHRGPCRGCPSGTRCCTLLALTS